MMSLLLPILSLATLVAILVVLIQVLLELRAVHDNMSSQTEWLLSAARPIGDPPSNRHTEDPVPHSGLLANGSLVMWEWSQGRWNVVSDTLPAGVDPGDPPDFEGEFEAEKVKKWVPRQP